MMESALPLLWAKLGRGEYPAQAHPVVCHLLDVGHSVWLSGIRLWDPSRVGTGVGPSEWMKKLQDGGSLSGLQPMTLEKSHRLSSSR